MAQRRPEGKASDATPFSSKKHAICSAVHIRSLRNVKSASQELHLKLMESTDLKGYVIWQKSNYASVPKWATEYKHLEVESLHWFFKFTNWPNNEARV